MPKKYYEKKYLTLILLCISPFLFSQILISENFDNYGFGDLPTNWTEENIGASTFGWGMDSAAPFLISGAKSAILYGLEDSWLITDGINLNAGQSIEVKFDYRTNTDGTANNFEVYIGQGNQSSVLTSVGTQLFADANLSAVTTTAFNQVYTAATGGTYFLGLHGAGVDGNSALSIDNLVVEITTLSVDEFNGKKKQYLYMVDGGFSTLEEVYVEVFDLAGRKVKSQNVAVGEKVALATGVYIVKVNVSNTFGNYKIVIK